MKNVIVVGYDGTACGHAALDFACDVAERLSSCEVVVAYGLPALPGGRGDRDPAGDDARGQGRP